MTRRLKKLVRIKINRNNLYHISFFSYKFHVYHVINCILSDTIKDVYTFKNMHDILTII